MNHLKNLLVVFILFLLFDLPFMIGINGKMYKSMFERINGVKQETWSTRTWITGTVAYLLMTAGLYFLVILPGLTDKTDGNNVNVNVVIKGALLGAVVTGVYDMTSMATLPNFGTEEGLIDGTWGTFMYGLITGICLHVL
jgi:uncharacterized membrane protein